MDVYDLEWQIRESAFLADFKGTCALCMCSVKVSNPCVRMDVEVFHHKHPRIVHVECAIDLIIKATLPADPEMAKSFVRDVHFKSLTKDQIEAMLV